MNVLCNVPFFWAWPVFHTGSGSALFAVRVVVSERIGMESAQF